MSYIFCISDYCARDFERSEYIETNKCMYELYEEFRTIQKTPNVYIFPINMIVCNNNMFLINKIACNNNVFSINMIVARVLVQMCDVWWCNKFLFFKIFLGVEK